MRYRRGLIIYIIMLDLIILGLTHLLFQETENSIWLPVANILILVISIFGVRLALKFSKPFSLLAAGAETLKSEDFSSTIRTTKSSEFNSIIDVYNRMIVQLRGERISHSETHNLLQLLLEASPSGIMIFDANHKLSKINRAALELLDIKETDIIGLTQQEISARCDQIFMQADQGLNNYLFKPNGTLSLKIQIGSFVDRGFETKFALIENLTSDIYMAEKRSFEKVIRMMSHEVSNSVSAVNSILETIEGRVEEAGGYRDAVRVCIDRNSNMNIFMRNFANVVKLPAPTLVEVDLNIILSKIVTLNRSRCVNNKIDLQENLMIRSLPIQGDQILLEQALMNIVKNSIEAIKEHDSDNSKRTIKISSTAAPTTITITDTGVGIPEERQKDIFTPFFSTKPMGQGIGLTLVREILSKHNCIFSLSSKGGVTSFTIKFLE